LFPSVVAWGRDEPVIVRIVPPKGLRLVLGVTLDTVIETEIAVAEASIGMIPEASLTIGDHVPATAVTKQVIWVEVD
jgi:hypothetical protein